MGEQSADTAQLWIAVIAIAVTIAVAVVGGLVGIIVMLLKRNADRSERHEEGRGRDVARFSERTQDRQVETAVDLSALEANVNVLMNDRGKCDALASKVAVLEDFKERAETKFDEVDEASRELRGMSEQIKTAFRRIDELPKAVTAEVLSKIPQAVLETLSAARALNTQQHQAGRAANG